MSINKVIIGTEVKLDLTTDTVSEDKLLAGATAHNAAGEQITGTMVTVPVDSELSDTSENAIQNKIVKQELDRKVKTTDIQDNLESADVTSPLSANQGKVLNEKISGHTDNGDVHVTTADKSKWNNYETKIEQNKTDIQNLQVQDDVLNSRIDNIATLPEGSTTADAELADIRVGADGTTYENAGTAVRKQVSELKSDLDTLNNIQFAIDYNNIVNIDFNCLETYSMGYLTIVGAIEPAVSHKILKLPLIYGVKNFTINSNENIPDMPIIAFYNADGTVIPNSAILGNGTKEQVITVSDQFPLDGYALLTWFKFNDGTYYNSLDNVSFKKITDFYKEEIEEIYNSLYIPTYKSCVNKPFDFNGKTALFFGDSITQGFTSGTTITPNGYPKLFSDKVGMNFTNYGVGGSCYSYDYNGVDSIVHKIEQTDLNILKSADYIFVAGGINDWQTGASLNQVSDSVGTLCQFFKENNITNVIFITPINHGERTPNEAPKAPLQQFRNIITIKALESDFSVVQGNEMPFPNEKDNQYFIDIMYGDKIHPTELGYRIYAKSLVTILC